MMAPQLSDIPLAHQSHASNPQPTAALSGLRTPASRRGVLRGVALSALSVGALSLTWGSSGRAVAEQGPGGLPGWDRNDCKDSYPDGYDEERDSGGQFKNAPGACFGGVISSEYCDASGWYRSDESHKGDTVTKYTPVSTACGQGTPKNAWKWRTPDGKVYRCSDGTMTVTVAGAETQNVFSICRSLVA